MASPIEAQRRRALGKANDVRSRRAELKRAIAGGRIDLARQLRGGAAFAPAVEEIADAMRVDELVRAVAGIGPTTALEVLEAAGVPSGARLSDLTNRRRSALAAEIERSTA